MPVDASFVFGSAAVRCSVVSVSVGLAVALRALSVSVRLLVWFAARPPSTHPTHGTHTHLTQHTDYTHTTHSPHTPYTPYTTPHHIHSSHTTPRNIHAPHTLHTTHTTITPHTTRHSLLRKRKSEMVCSWQYIWDALRCLINQVQQIYPMLYNPFSR